MATNHTPELARCEEKAIEFLWKYCGYKGVSVKTAKRMAFDGALSINRLLEIALERTGKLKHSNKKGEDFADGSDAKYATSRNRMHNSNSKYSAERNWADVGGLDNKRGTLRIYINFNDWNRGVHKPLMFKIPYKVWASLVQSSGNLKFYFSSKDGELTKITKERFGEYQVDTFEELAS
jgi:hypothetical protein